jgi:hypothetical protein
MIIKKENYQLHFAGLTFLPTCLPRGLIGLPSRHGHDASILFASVRGGHLRFLMRSSTTNCKPSSSAHALPYAPQAATWQAAGKHGRSQIAAHQIAERLSERARSLALGWMGEQHNAVSERHFCGADSNKQICISDIRAGARF